MFETQAPDAGSPQSASGNEPRRLVVVVPPAADGSGTGRRSSTANGPSRATSPRRLDGRRTGAPTARRSGAGGTAASRAGTRRERRRRAASRARRGAPAGVVDPAQSDPCPAQRRERPEPAHADANGGSRRATPPTRLRDPRASIGRRSQPRNRSVTCRCSGGTQRASGNALAPRRDRGVDRRATAAGTSTATNSRSGARGRRSRPSSTVAAQIIRSPSGSGRPSR